MTTRLRDEVHALAEQLPEDATWDDVLERLRFRAGIEAGKAAADRGEFASDADIRRVFGKFGVGT
jgi:predicted transcriptional regulator